MEVNEDLKIELFNEFYQWLKEDGLKPVKSERLHRKKIFSSLLNNHQHTIDNFYDFLIYKQAHNLKNRRVVYKNIQSIIEKVILTYSPNIIKLFTFNNQIIEVKFNKLESFIKECIQE